MTTKQDEIKYLRMNAVRDLLSSVGEDVNREGLIDTPNRVARMYEEIFSGYSVDPVAVLGTTFEEDNHNEMIVVKDIPFYSHCEHHMVPFFGKIHISYIPQGKIVGLSKLARLVECFARRLQIQERLTSQIADTIVEVMEPMGVMVVVEAEHMCMTMRGVQKPGTTTITSAVRGVYADNGNIARQECLQFMK